MSLDHDELARQVEIISDGDTPSAILNPTSHNTDTVVEKWARVVFGTPPRTSNSGHTLTEYNIISCYKNT